MGTAQASTTIAATPRAVGAWHRDGSGLSALAGPRYDLIAGIVLAAILVPQGMAYAELAGVPAVNGLYTTIACLIGYARSVRRGFWCSAPIRRWHR